MHDTPTSRILVLKKYNALFPNCKWKQVFFTLRQRYIIEMNKLSKASKKTDLHSLKTTHNEPE